MVICVLGMIPAVGGLAFADILGKDLESIYEISLVSAFVLGFFVMSAGPIGFQYAAEVSFPVRESTSQGILLWVGQLTGIFFVAGMSVKNNLYLGSFMNAFAVLILLAFAAVLLLRESPMILGEGESAGT